MVHTSEYGARLSSVPSGDRSVTPAILGASRHSNLQRVLLLASTQKRSSPERLATSKNILTTDRSAVSCRVSISGHQTSSSEHPRGQSQETGSLSTFSGSVETSAKCISMGPAHCRKRVLDSVRISPASVQWDISHPSGPRPGSGNGTRSRDSLEEGGHQGGPSSRHRVRVLQPLLHCSEKGWRSAFNSQSKMTEPLRHETQVQDAYYQTSCVPDQVRGLV